MFARKAFTRALTLATVLSLLMSTVALADNVQNDVAASAGGKIVTITAGSATGATVNYKIQETSGDSTDVGQARCNAADGSAAVVTPTGLPSGAAKSPTSVSFTQCGIDQGITFTASATTIPGDYPIGATVGDTEAVSGDYNTSPAAFTLRVEAPSDSTAPVIVPAITGTLGGGGWYVSNVSLTWTVTDVQSTITSTSNCGPVNITSDQADTLYTCSATSAGGTASESVTIKRDATAPSAPTAGFSPASAWSDIDGNSWYKGSVLVSFSGSTDPTPGSGVASYSANYARATTGSLSYSGTATDIAGNVSLPTTGTVMVDADAPLINCATPATAWSNADITVVCNASDGSGSGITGVTSVTLTTSVSAGDETSSASTDSATFSDHVGYSSQAGPFTGLKVDKKAPVVECDSADGMWHNDNVAIDCTATDGGSGIAAADQAFQLSTNVPAGSENGNASTGTRQVQDGVLNSTQAGPIAGNMVDRKGPVVTVTCPTTPVILGSSASASWMAIDGGSGVQSIYRLGGSIALNTATVGSKTATAVAGTAVDNVGNSSALATCTYSVVYDFTGFFRPVDNLPTLNVAKAGSAIPLKFSLGGEQGLSILAAGSPTSKVSSCDVAGAPDAIEETVTAGNSSLSYDAATGQYNYVWKTDKGWAGTCRTLTMVLADGTAHQALFKLTK